jgi:molybdopterin-guanine dinucleotide biosynthesis protein A
MGADKASLRLGQESLLDRALRLARTVTEDVRIIGEATKFAGIAAGRVIEDIYRERGPLGGIHAALSNTASDLNLMFAVDMPLMKPEFLAYLITQARESGATVTVPNAGGGFQPLCAVYGRKFAEIAEASLQAGKNKIDPLFAKVSTRIIGEDELARAGFSPEMFRNLNTPEDVEQIRHSAASEASEFRHQL